MPPCLEVAVVGLVGSEWSLSQLCTDALRCELWPRGPLPRTPAAPISRRTEQPPPDRPSSRHRLHTAGRERGFHQGVADGRVGDACSTDCLKRTSS